MIVEDDLTERWRIEQKLREAEAQLYHARKMDIIGQLVAGIVHDFNNQLTVINGYGRLLMEDVQDDDKRLTYLQRILSAADRAEQLTHQILAYSRRQVLQPQVINLNQIVVTTEQMLSRLIGEHIEIKTELEPKLENIHADPTQFEQILMNLILNARDAMPNGGAVTITTNNTLFRHEQLTYLPHLQPGPYVALAVTDTGIGMTGEVRSQIFEPFFTTKEQGKGIGLGLASAYAVVKQGGGEIWVESTVNVGSRFVIYFPAHKQDMLVEKPMDVSAHLSTGGESILVVDEHEAVRNYVREILEIRGYQVRTAPSGPIALQVENEQSGPLDLLVTDVVMPQMNGVELANRLINQHRQAKVLYISGYSELAQQLTQSTNGDIHLLAKPFTPEALANKVRSLLG